MVVARKHWLELVEESWHERNLIWLAGVRRVGKTFLCQSIPGVEYFDCELPRIRRLLDDPQGFLDSVKGKKIVLDEIHRLDNPSELLKIAADHYPDAKIIATGSSTLGASRKFKDTLSGRKRNLWLTPMLSADLVEFNNTNINHRLLSGGLPPFFVSPAPPEKDFQEWMDDYWNKDILELFHLERKASFQKFVELLLVRSGGLFEATNYAAPCEVSRTTIANYLKSVEATYVAHIIKPFSRHKASEIISIPKVYAFDTGFICYYRGWYNLRNEDKGFLWEHYVLNEIQGKLQNRNIGYWRNKQGQEVDFVLAERSGDPIAIECKWTAKNFEPGSLESFRRQYPTGKNYCVAHDIDRPYICHSGGIPIKMTDLNNLIKELASIKFSPVKF